MFNSNFNPMNNPYVANAYNTQSWYTSQSQNQTLIRVTGMDGARAYQMSPNSVVPLFDSDNDIMYIKSTDGAGFPTIKAFRFEAYEPTQQPLQNDFVTRAEFNELKGMIDNVKQFIPTKFKQPNDEQSIANDERV